MPAMLASGNEENEHCNLEPIMVYTEKDLEQQLSSVVGHLKNKNQEMWLNRLNSLKTLQGLVKGGAAELECFLPLLKTLKEPLGEAVADLRSTLVKEACATCELLSMTLQNAFAPTADTIILNIFKQIPVKIQVISDSTQSCLHTVITHTHSSKLIPRLLEGAKNKQQIVRWRSIQAINTCLVCWSTGDLDRHVDAMESSIVSGLKDSHAEVRQASREAVVSYSSTYPERYKKVVSSLDLATQKLLVSASKGQDEAPGLARRVSRPASAPISKRASTATAAVDGAPLAQTMKQRPVTSKVENGGGLSASDLSSSSGAGGRASMLAKRVLGGSHGPGGGLPRGSLSASAGPTADVTSSRASRGGSGPQRVLVSSSSGATSQHRGDGEGADAGDALSEAEVGALVEGAWPPSWSMRVQRVETLRRLVDEGRVMGGGGGSRGGKGWGGRIASIAIEGLGDGHFKVEEASILLISSLSSRSPGCLSSHIDTLMMKLVPLLASKKLADEASLLLEAITEQHGSHTTIPHVLRGLDDKAPAQRTACLVHLTPSIPSLSSKDARYICGRLASLSADKNEGPRRAYSEAMASLRDHHAHALMEGLAALGPQPQLQCLRMCGASLPNLAQEVGQYISSGQVPSMVPSADTASPRGGGNRASAAAKEWGKSSGRRRTGGEKREREEYDDWVQGHGLEQERPAPVANAAPAAPPSSSSASPSLCTSAAPLSPAADTSAPSPSAAATSNRKEGAHCEGEWAQGNEEAQDAGIPSLIRDVLEGGGAEASEAARTLGLLLCPPPGGGSGDAALCEDWCTQVLSASSHRLKQTGLNTDPASSSAPPTSPDDDLCLAPIATLVRSLVKNQPAISAELASTVVEGLIACCGATSLGGGKARRAGEASAMGALKETLAQWHPSLTLSILPPLLTSASAAPALSHLATAAKVTPANVLEHDLPSLLPPLLSAFSSSHAHVRKGVVLALVAMHSVMGDALLGRLDALTPPQLKLLTIYIDRSNAEKEAASLA